MSARKKRKRRYAAPIGGLFVLLALIGAAAVVTASIQLTRRVLDNSAEKRKIEDIIRPVVMFDPAPFEKASDIDPLLLLQYSMWAALTGEKRSTYTFGENAEMLVPASDLDMAAAGLFGNEVVLQHRTFGDYQATYYYDEANQVYDVPVIGQQVYTPRVEGIELDKEAGLYIVTVGYIPPGNAWTTNFSGERGEPTPDKYMLYVMRKTRDGYQLVAVRDTPAAAAGATEMRGDIIPQG